MKRFNYIAFLAAVAAAVSCEVNEPMEDPHDGLVSYNVPADAEWSEFIFTSESEGEDSRTVHSGNTILWSAGDQIRMGYTVGTTWQGADGNATSGSPAKLYASEALTAQDISSTGGTTASFTVPGYFAGGGSGTYKFYTVYPAAAVSENFSSAPNTTVTIPTEQTPASGSFDPAADLMIGQSVRTYSSKPSEAIPLKWTRKVAHGEITLKNLTLSNGETVQKVTLTAQSGAALTGTYSLNLSEGTLSSSSGASNSVSVSGSGLVYNSGNLTFWIGILPVTFTSLEVALETNKAVYTRTFDNIEGGREFKVNTHTKLGINMAPASRKEKAYVLVESEPTDWSGSYVLVYKKSEGNKILTSISTATSTPYGLAADVTVTDNTISLADGENYEITIAKPGDYYTLSLGGEYLGWSSGNSLKSGSSANNNDFKWSIAYAGDGVVTITNTKDVNRLLQYNSGSPRFACYTGTQQNPSLFRWGIPTGGGTTPEPDPEATATVTTGNVTKGETTATLNASFSGNTGTVSETGFYWGTSNNPSTKIVVGTGAGVTSQFSTGLTGLTAGTTYYYKAYVLEYDGVEGAPVERCSAVASFTTNEAAQVMADYELVTATQSDWSGAYVLGYLESSTSAILLTGISSSNIGSISSSITVSSNKIAYSAGNQYEVTITKSGNYYTIALGGQYLGWSSGNTLSSDSSASSDNYKWSISYSSSALTIANAADSSRKLQYNSGSPRFACYTSSQKAPELFKRAGSSTPQVTVTTEAVSNLANTSVTLNGSYVVPTGLSVTERGFYFGTGSDPTTKITVSGTGTSFSISKTGLTKGTAYSYKAYAIESDGTTTTTRYGEVVYFTTTGGDNVPTGWLELPATTGTNSENFVGTFYGSGGTTARYRNYSYSYNYTYYASMWVAWPLCAAHTNGNASTSSWRYNPDITPNSRQVNIVSKSYGTMYGNDSYARGHQCPNADRKSDDTMNLQTYYSTNQTPQLQNKFNGSIWGSLETATRNLVSGSNASATMVYVATGPVYRKVGGSETISYLTGANSNANPSSLAIPNYYWKALLKVQWDGDYVTSASAIGFWFDHREYASSEHYYDSEHIVSVDQIEQWTGLDLFTNLPDGIEATAESNASWSSFQSFIGESESAFQ